MALAHTDRAYESELKDLREKLLSMGGKVEVAISRCVRSVTERDSDLAQKVKEGEREINRLEVEIDDACRRLLALRQPAASDLRFITTALKIVTDLERMGDLAVNIAQRAFDLNQAPPLKPFPDLTKLADLAQEQLKKALDARPTLSSIAPAPGPPASSDPGKVSTEGLGSGRRRAGRCLPRGRPSAPGR